MWGLAGSSTRASSARLTAASLTLEGVGVGGMWVKLDGIGEG